MTLSNALISSLSHRRVTASETGPEDMGLYELTVEGATPGTFTVDLAALLVAAGEASAGPYWVALNVWIEPADGTATAVQGFQVNYTNQLGDAATLVNSGLPLAAEAEGAFGPFPIMRDTNASLFELFFNTSVGTVGTAKLNYAVSIVNFG